MSTTRGIRTLVGVALASSVLLLAGCSSSGSTGTKAAAGSSSTSTSAPATDKSSSSSGSDSSSSSSSSSSPSGDSSSSSSDSSSGGDPGCTAAEQAATSGLSKMNAGDPAGAKKALDDTAKLLHDAAGKAKKPGAAAAINKVADDYTGLANALSTGKMPDTNAIMTDATAMATACGG